MRTARPKTELQFIHRHIDPVLQRLRDEPSAQAEFLGWIGSQTEDKVTPAAFAWRLGQALAGKTPSNFTAVALLSFATEKGWGLRAATLSQPKGRAAKKS